MIEIRENVLLAPFTTLGVGGPARYFVEAASESDIVDALTFADSALVDVFVLGGGSNVVISDQGFDGLVLHIGLKGIVHGHEPGTLTVAAGEDWDAFVAYAVACGLAGVECLSGIPGTVGGTPVQNVGAYGQEVSSSIVSVRCYDRVGRRFVVLDNKECGFSYRSSVFNTGERGRHIVSAVSFALTPGGNALIAYRDLERVFDGCSPSLEEVREAVLSIRRAKSMVIDPADPNSRSVGSFFKNPIIAEQEISRIADAAGSEPPRFAAGSGSVKVPAAWLIENAGFKKGHVMGAAGISTNHTLAIINRGNATARDIAELELAIREQVRDVFEIELEPEPVFVGGSIAK